MSDHAGRLDHSIFARHLDLTPLGSRRRGLVRCRFHPDTAGSLSVDLDRGIFHCFGCGEQGGLKRFAELVGEGQPAVPPLTEEPTAWRLAIQQAKLEPWSRPGVRDLYLAADFIRHERRRIQHLRAEATDTDAGWEALAEAARAESFVEAVEAEWGALLDGWHP